MCHLRQGLIKQLEASLGS